MTLHAVKRTPTTREFYAANWHLILYRPSQPHGNYSGWGFHFRWRRQGLWHHLLVKLHAKSKTILPGQRRCRIYEVVGWRTKHPTNGAKRLPHNRIGFKSYVRLKLCPGGTRPEERAEEVAR